MPLIVTRDAASREVWVKRGLQEACRHAFPSGVSAWLSGTIYSWRWDKELDRYASGPTYRRVCMLCDLVIDRAVPTGRLKDLIALNAPSQSWLRANGFAGWNVELHETEETGAHEAVYSRYAADQDVRQQLRDERRS